MAAFIIALKESNAAVNSFLDRHIYFWCVRESTQTCPKRSIL